MKKFILLFIFGITIATVADDYRNFTDKDGRTIKARVVKVNTQTKKVTMERENKKQTTVPISVFSEADQEYINSWEPTSSIASNINDEGRWRKMVSEGEALLHKKEPSKAIEKYLDPVIEYFDSLRNENSPQIYCARDSKETLVYLMQAAVMNLKDEGKDIPEHWGNRFAEKKNSAEVLPQFWAEAFYLKSYALVELGKNEQAKATLQKAVGLSPCNSTYLAELGNIYQTEKNWGMAMQAYKASGDAILYSPPTAKDSDQARAWRGEGFVLIELGKLDEAKEKYKQCLKLNPKDKTALAELKYIESL